MRLTIMIIVLSASLSNPFRTSPLLSLEYRPYSMKVFSIVWPDSHSKASFTVVAAPLARQL